MGPRLLALIGVCIATACAVTMVSAGALMWLARDVLHAGCSQTSLDGATAWGCADGVGYAIPTISLVAALTIVGTVAGIRVWPALGTVSERAAFGRALSIRCGSAAVIIGVVATIWAAVAGRPGVASICGAVVVVGGVAVVAARSGRLRAAAIVDVAVAGLLVVATPGAGIGAPFVVVSIGAFLVAGALSWPVRTLSSDNRGAVDARHPFHLESGST